jgi:hypothetical protein
MCNYDASDVESLSTHNITSNCLLWSVCSYGYHHLVLDRSVKYFMTKIPMALPHKLISPTNSIASYTWLINRLTPNDLYMSRTAPLTSKRCILYIYSTNVGTEYFIHALYSPFFFSSKCSLFHNANLFGSCIIHILYTGCAEIKKIIIPAPKG